MQKLTSIRGAELQVAKPTCRVNRSRVSVVPRAAKRSSAPHEGLPGAAVLAGLGSLLSSSAAFASEEAVQGAAAVAKEAAAAIQETAAVADSAAAAAPKLEEAAVAIQQAAAAAQDIAQPALKAAEPAVKAALEQLTKALPELDSEDALTTAAAAASTATTAAGSLLQQLVVFLTTTDPATLGEDAVALVVISYLVPPLGRALVKSLRGYSGEVLPTTALDALASQGSNVLVDIRTAKDKEAGGVPDLADSGKLVELEFVQLGDEKLADRLRNPVEVQAELTAIEISALKKLNKGMTLYIMDSNNSTAKAVAKDLSRRGFGKVFVVSGGYQAWTSSKLKTRTWEAPGAAKALLSPASTTPAVSSS